MEYRFTNIEKNKMRGQVILDRMENLNEVFSTDFVFNCDLRVVFVQLMLNGLVNVGNGVFIITERGKEALTVYKNKYNEFIKFYDVYNAVDLSKTNLDEEVFALSRYYDFDTDEEYHDFVENGDFTDMRVSVLKYKGINPLEYVFISRLDEYNIYLLDEDWIDVLMNDGIFDEIEDICNSADCVSDDDFQEVMPMIMEVGTHVLRDIKMLEYQLYCESIEAELDEEIEEIITFDVIDYDEYLDPLFIGTCMYYEHVVPNEVYWV